MIPYQGYMENEFSLAKHIFFKNPNYFGKTCVEKNH
jgi:hypothetical protein